MERNAVAEQEPLQRDEDHHRKALHHRSQNILATHETGIKQGQSRACHHENEG